MVERGQVKHIVRCEMAFALDTRNQDRVTRSVTLSEAVAASIRTRGGQATLEQIVQDIVPKDQPLVEGILMNGRSRFVKIFGTHFWSVK